MIAVRDGYKFIGTPHGILLRRLRGPLEDFKAAKHVYSQLCPWNNVRSFVDHLLKNICYNRDGLVILNKPYGISVKPPTKKNFLSESYLLNTAVVGDCQETLLDALPYIAEELGYRSLSPVKTPGRYASGITILSADESVAKNVRKSMNYGKVQDKVIYNYWLVVVGQPQPDSGSENIGITLKKGPGQLQVILETKWSKKSVKRQEIFPTFVEYSTLEKGSLCSLVEFKTSRTKWHFIRIYSAYLLSPVLGDHLYGGRVQHVLGIPVAISPYSDHAKLPQRLSKQLVAALELKPGEDLIIPAHIHFKSLILRSYEGKNNDLIIDAPPPDYFLWSCKKLMLERACTSKINFTI
ncbi:mitochondrial mRNA pseudouridine synthase RPUSD3-like isoform X2 [Schistocerca americana]|uniref:mitochondrial mRNA pseudouridine synthase RPUSD3-like isoform X2 n=1 Tax=Schistocerca americana TaxID=7009 RepID=UPI001F503F70|nr:mitochondrial mRNA pseudouridine synthase RPUSD3-like isoform X2 [Schistocerca americana]